jgi:serum/glucocorticoid-regulated kinase 2
MTITLDSKFTTEGNKKLSIDSFELIKVLGKGSFGKVMLVKKKGGDGTLFAMKTLRKAALIKRNQLLHTATERNILQNIQHPFLVNLIYAFQSEDKLYMVLDYMGGGELFFWLKKHRRFSEPRAQLMGAEITLALGALHASNIIYRDLKPENILVDLEGHIRLTDFGLSKDGITGPGAEGGTKTFCGTPEYLAPEILDNKGHGKSVDWWSFGTLLYEMLCGLPPFYDTNIQKMYHKILCAPLRFPSYLSDDSKTILRGLLQRKVEERLGSGPGGTDEIKNADFFKSLDFDRVMAKEYTPEFKPPAGRNDTDATNFDAEFTSERAVDSVVTSHMSETAKEKSNFQGFTYQNEGAMES